MLSQVVVKLKNTIRTYVGGRLPLPVLILFCDQKTCYEIINGAGLVVEESLARFEAVCHKNPPQTEKQISRVVRHLRQLQSMVLTIQQRNFDDLKKRRIYVAKVVKQCHEMHQFSLSAIRPAY